MTYKEYRFFVEADRLIAGRPKRTFKRRIKLFLVPDYIEQFMLVLRKVEYLTDKKGIFQRINSLITKNRFNKISLKLGFSIPPNVFGPGLYIPHYGTIVVSRDAKVGANCVLHTSTCIAGAQRKKMGDNLYISTGVIISGNTNIPDNVSIGANSLVNKTVSKGNVFIAGTPAEIVREKGAWYTCAEHGEFGAAVKKIEELRKNMFE